MVGASQSLPRLLSSATRPASTSDAAGSAGFFQFSLSKEVIMATARPRNEVEAEIREALGLVPSFFHDIPDAILDYEWTLFRRFELEETVIPNKYKELMGIALHSETKCDYCVLFHTEAAKLFGATDEEIQEAVHYAKYSLGWSAYVNGMQVDFDTFKDELRKIGEHLSAGG
jgi:AhpD family alkylhydroperoxidase